MVTTGPMAKNVCDTAFMCSVIAGPDRGDPLTLPDPGITFLDALTPLNDQEIQGLRVAFSTDLGSLAIDPEVAQTVREAAKSMKSLGMHVAEAAPDLEGAMDVFQVQRAAGLRLLAARLDSTDADWRDKIKDTARWNIEKGLALSADELTQSELQRTVIYQRVSRFFEDYDALIIPAAQVPPFDANLDWVSEINGVNMPTYIDWMAVCCMISVTGLPAISVPGASAKMACPLGANCGQTSG